MNQEEKRTSDTNILDHARFSSDENHATSTIHEIGTQKGWK